MLRRLLAFPVALLAAAPFNRVTPSPKSDPVGVYAIVDRVVFEPDAANPKAIQVWGVFAMSEGKPGDNYRPAERGYLYYAINPKNERATLAEWTDLKDIAGRNEPVGFGAKYAGLGHLRHAADVASNPETYPLGIGLVKVSGQGTAGVAEIVRQLRAAAQAPQAGRPKSPGRT